jgi:hypothetical protein
VLCVRWCVVLGCARASFLVRCPLRASSVSTSCQAVIFPILPSLVVILERTLAEPWGEGPPHLNPKVVARSELLFPSVSVRRAIISDHRSLGGI